MTRFGELASFDNEFEANIDHYGNKMDNKIDLLARLYDKNKVELDKCNERLKSLPRQYNEAIDEIFEELMRKMKENKKTCEKVVEELEKIKRIQLIWHQNIVEVNQQVRQMLDNLLQQLQQQLQNVEQQQGLSPRSIQRFHLFTADETLVGQKCAICLEDITVSRRLRRLTCDGQHAFCQGCCETWFANNNTCPLCRHAFV